MKAIVISKEILKNQVKILREFLKENHFDLGQSSAYHLLSKVYGYKNWNILSSALNEPDENI